MQSDNVRIAKAIVLLLGTAGVTFTDMQIEYITAIVGGAYGLFSLYQSYASKKEKKS